MGYMHIDNLYKNQTILMFKECYAMEKIHGTSAHIGIRKDNDVVQVKIFSGGENYANFTKLFDCEFLKQKFAELNLNNIIIFGEAYGGKQQGMKDTYGDKLKFVAFEVMIGEKWLGVTQAEVFCKEFNIEFVHYDIVKTDIEILDVLASAPSVQAKRNGILEDKLREGIILRPLIEVTKNNGDRIIAKHKNEKFKEREHQPKVKEDNLVVLTEIDAIVDEWVTEMRLSHILGKRETYNIENTGEILSEMVEDILREAKNEILISENNKGLISAIKRRTAQLFKERIKNENLK
jgi:hypothetical protein